MRGMAKVSPNVAQTTPDEAQHNRRQREQKSERKTGEKKSFHMSPDWLVVGVLLVLEGVNEATRCVSK
jgi:hypothetical protein